MAGMGGFHDSLADGGMGVHVTTNLTDGKLQDSIPYTLERYVWCAYCSSSRLNTSVNRATVSTIPMTMK